MNPEILAVEVFAFDTVAVQFSIAMKVTLELQVVQNWSVVSESVGDPVTVRAVRVENTQGRTSRVYLIVSKFSIGQQYVVSAAETFQATNGQALVAPGNAARFIGRATKIDSLVRSRPRLYTNDPTSWLRALLTALGREDDLIGGDRKDTLPSV